PSLFYSFFLYLSLSSSLPLSLFFFLLPFSPLFFYSFSFFLFSLSVCSISLPFLSFFLLQLPPPKLLLFLHGVTLSLSEIAPRKTQTTALTLLDLKPTNPKNPELRGRSVKYQMERGPLRSYDL
ncbi:unnamed protein product, partial [Prunus brigantina]